MSQLQDFVESVNDKSNLFKITLLLAIIGIIGGAYWYFFWSPKAEELKRAQVALQKQETILNEYKNIEKELPKFELEFSRLSREFQEAARKLPEEKEIPNLIDSIYAAVSASGLRSDAFQSKGEVRREVYAEIPVEIRVFGSYYDIASFFDRVSKLPRIVNINDLNLKRDEVIRDKVELEASFTAVTFRLLPLAALEADGGKDNKGAAGRRVR